MKQFNIVVLGSTKGTDLEPIITAIEKDILFAKILAVISNKSDAYILERARNHNLPVFLIESKGAELDEYNKKILTKLNEFNPDLIVLIGYMKILPPEVVRAFPNKIINVHPSLLPAFSGGMDLNVHQAVIDSGIKETGCTVHFVDETIDGGKIILQKKCAVTLNDTTDSLKNKVQELEGEALIEVINNFSQKL
ncbi:MAG: phosphoribosylglycinamide formyltransferase [Candidatus Magasanikbacteria bacterium RIFOXYD2_FULL_41_14]|uniref:Phosphoribosylglycinamide formyltransferase n=1 Tax=Candidatus Magasanikbacteria bacterium RIFOXYD2_FULL_41_14 TaxID=1798709 RepID=A0A1F6PEU7_9BACT|nr:MAG: phosphoribosylglycinamide formyltransferase [Candidatus Magasanikbacteria bacterium RIFOXYD2_FULL_41_14]